MSWFCIHTEIPRGLFSFLHPPHGAWQHKQGLHPTKGAHKSLLQVGLDWKKSWNPKYAMCSDSTTCSTTEVVESCSFAILSLPSSRCSGNSPISQFCLNLLQEDFSIRLSQTLFRHQKFGHHSQSEFSQRRHKSRPQENQQVSLLLFHNHHFEGFLHWRVSRLCQQECSALERNYWRLGLCDTRSQLMQLFVPGAFGIQPYGGSQLGCVNISPGRHQIHSQVPRSQTGPLEASMSGPCQSRLLQGGHFVAESFCSRNLCSEKIGKASEKSLWWSSCVWI